MSYCSLQAKVKENQVKRVVVWLYHLPLDEEELVYVSMKGRQRDPLSLGEFYKKCQSVGLSLSDKQKIGLDHQSVLSGLELF